MRQPASSRHVRGRRGGARAMGAAARRPARRQARLRRGRALREAGHRQRAAAAEQAHRVRTPPRPCGRGQGVRGRGAGKGGEAGMGYFRHRDSAGQRPLRRAGETGRHRDCRQRRKRPRDCASRGRHPCSRTARQRRLPARSRGNRRRSAPARTNQHRRTHSRGHSRKRATRSLPHQPPAKPNSPRTRCSWWTSWAASSFCADAA